MMWFDKRDQRCLFGDLRTESHYLKDRGNLRHLEIHPDVRLDFTALPFADDSFNLVVFDPPHLVRAGKKSWLAKKYGQLTQDWRDDLSKASLNVSAY
ncbi:class I SAM-dependent rRNA methyltransferase [Neisseria subflava]|uniref:class I SAM-dependent rRNA methyltransferase n=1 Tax=Neisseria subflava TaxID=28449 RepID=UPI00202A2F99|nr:class I SAM-dependent rRNA methyltransferase [Neisseria subflava]